MGCVLGRLADQPGERDERRRGQDEERDVPEVRVTVEGDDERPEREQGEEDPAYQGAATLSSGACCAPFSSTGETPSSISPTTRGCSPPAGRPASAPLSATACRAPSRLPRSSASATCPCSSCPAPSRRSSI